MKNSGAIPEPVVNSQHSWRRNREIRHRFTGRRQDSVAKLDERARDLKNSTQQQPAKARCGS